MISRHPGMYILCTSVFACPSNVRKFTSKHGRVVDIQQTSNLGIGCSDLGCQTDIRGCLGMYQDLHMVELKHFRSSGALYLTFGLLAVEIHDAGSHISFMANFWLVDYNMSGRALKRGGLLCRNVLPLKRSTNYRPDGRCGHGQLATALSRTSYSFSRLQRQNGIKKHVRAWSRTTHAYIIFRSG